MGPNEMTPYYRNSMSPIERVGAHYGIMRCLFPPTGGRGHALITTLGVLNIIIVFAVMQPGRINPDKNYRPILEAFMKILIISITGNIEENL